MKFKNLIYKKERLFMKINNKQEFDKQNIFGLGKENTAFAKYF